MYTTYLSTAYTYQSAIFNVTTIVICQRYRSITSLYKSYIVELTKKHILHITSFKSLIKLLETV